MVELQQCEEHIIQEKATLQHDRAKIEDDRQQIQKDREHLEAEKATMMSNGVGSNNLVGLNFRGEKTMVMKRSVLCQVEGSMLAAMFSGRYENNLDYDRDGNVYVGYPPSVMVPLMDWLTACQDAPTEAQCPHVDIPTCQQTIWDGVVKFFGLESVPAPPSLQMFNGVKRNLKISDLEGWHLALCKHCTELTTMADFSLPGISHDSPVLVGAKKPSEDRLLVAAIGRLDVIASQDNQDRHHNNVYWSLNDRVLAFCEEQVGISRLQNVDQSFVIAGHKGACWSFHSDTAALKFEKIIMVPKKHSSLAL